MTLLGVEGHLVQIHVVSRLNGVWRPYCWNEVMVAEVTNGSGDNVRWWRTWIRSDTDNGEL